MPAMIAESYMSEGKCETRKATASIPCFISHSLFVALLRVVLSGKVVLSSCVRR